MKSNSKTPGIDEPASATQFSIVIPAWNESGFIVNAVNAAKEAIQHQSYNGEIIVVDNNSTDDTAAKAKETGAIVVFEEHNQIARARNAGARAGSSPWIVFVDADSILSPTLLKLALNALSSGDVIGGGSTVAADKPIQGFGARLLAFWNWVSVKTRTAAGCFIYCKRDAFEHIGGFSEKLYAAEELLLSRQLKKQAKQKGLRFVIHKEAPITTSARKLDWYSPLQMVWQFLLLLIPGSTLSRKMCGMWYNRNNQTKN